MANLQRKTTHYVIVALNILIALFLLSIPMRRWTEELNLSRILVPETRWSEVGIKTMKESLGFVLLSLLAICGSVAELKRKMSAVLLNIGVPFSLLSILVIEYSIHRNDHPEENGIALVITVVPVCVLLFAYVGIYLREYMSAEQQQ